MIQERKNFTNDQALIWAIRKKLTARIYEYWLKYFKKTKDIAPEEQLGLRPWTISKYLIGEIATNYQVTSVEIVSVLVMLNLITKMRETKDAYRNDIWKEIRNFAKDFSKSEIRQVPEIEIRKILIRNRKL